AVQHLVGYGNRPGQFPYFGSLRVRDLHHQRRRL
ncbi:uncharacterized protein METZ01_LOCUS390413, partial [marine metagenome]